jgi:DNA modification methylase
MKIENIKTDKLIPYARNAKLHDENQVGKIASSIREFGFNNPVLVDGENPPGIIAGHGRVLAAKKLGLAEVPCIRLGHLSEAQKRAYILADNRLAELGGGWDAEILKMELAELGELDVDLDGIGFGEDDIGDLDFDLGDGAGNGEADAEPQIDKAEELREKWDVQPGQLWQLGEHRILCGDSTNAEDVARVMGGEKADCGFSDPPYGISYKSGTWSDKRKNTLKELENDNLQGASLHDFLQGFYKQQKAVTTGDIYICCEWKSYPAFYAALTPLDKLTNVIVWDKRFQTQALNTFAFTHEFILFFGNNGGPYRDTNVWQCDREFSDFHATPKPVKLVAKAINHSDGKIVTDFFSGSGTTIIACEQLGRKCRAVEISPGYVAVAIQRFFDATGKEPKLIK